ncbi:hypothetical protein HMPREF1419_00927, partial [Helicobacter pylori GAM263BFi]
NKQELKILSKNQMENKIYKRKNNFNLSKLSNKKSFCQAILFGF